MRSIALKFLFVPGVFLLLAGTPSSAQNKAIRKTPVAITKIPISFEPNRGQASSSTRFIARADNVVLGLRPMGFDLNLGDSARQSSPLKFDFVNSDPDASITGSDRRTSETNYFIGRDSSSWKTHVPNYGRVTYSSIYPGVDVAFYGIGQHLEHDFLIAPGADYHIIRMHLNGSDKISQKTDGSLVISLPNGDVVFHPPNVYQVNGNKREPRIGRFILVTKNEIGFKVARYDRSEPLIIDPVLDYATYLTNSIFLTFGVATDATGNSYVAGCAQDPVTEEAPLVVIKVNASGTALVYASYFGSTCQPYGGIKVDANGDAVVAVSTYLPGNFPVVNPILNPGNAGVWNGYVCSLSPDGSSLNYASLLGGSGPYTTYLYGVALDPSGNAYVTGTTDWPDFPQTPGALNNASPAYPNYATYVTKFLANGSLGYSAFIGNGAAQNGGGGLVDPTGIAVDNSGSAYITGSAGSLWPTTNGAYQTQIPGASPYAAPFVTSISADGSALRYSTFLGSNGVPAGIVVNKNGEVVVAGYGVSASFPTTSNAYQKTSTSSASFFSIFNATGTQLVYSSFLNSTQILSVSLDASGDIWLAGTTGDPQFPLVHPLDSTIGVPAGALPGFLSEFDPTGATLNFSTYLGDITAGAQNDEVAIDSNGRAHLAGVSDYNFYTTPGAYIATEIAPPPRVQYLYGFIETIDPSVAAPSVCISYPANDGLYFQDQNPSQQELLIANCGTLRLTITGIQSSSAAATLLWGSNGCLQQIAVNGSCTVIVNYTGTPSTNPQIAVLFDKLTVTSNASIPESVLLVGHTVYDPDFIFSTNPLSPPTATISAPGASSSPLTLTISDQPGYSGTLNFTATSCSISPAGSMSSCGFTPASVMGSGSTQVVVNTTAPSSAILLPAHHLAGYGTWVSGGLALGLILLAGVAAGNQCRWKVIFTLATLGVITACSSCGGGSAGSSGSGNGNGGTPTGIVYTVTVTATGITSHAVSFQMVQ